MIGGELDFEILLRQLVLRRGHDPSIVDEDVDLLEAQILELFDAATHLHQIRQIELDHVAIGFL